MKIYLKLFDGELCPVNVPDGTKEIAGIVLSGDEVLIWPVFRDPNRAYRFSEFSEGPFYRRLNEAGEWVDFEPEDEQ